MAISDLINLLVLVGIGYLFYLRFAKGINPMEKIREGTRKFAGKDDSFWRK